MVWVRQGIDNFLQDPLGDQLYSQGEEMGWVNL